MAARFKKKFLAAYGAEKQQHQAQSDPSLQQSHAGDNTTQVCRCTVCKCVDFKTVATIKCNHQGH
jgi:hypothetical protein